MIIKSQVGTFTVTAVPGASDHVVLTATDRDALVSVLDGIELIGGAEGEDPLFTAADIEQVPDTTSHRVLVSRAALVRYFDYEILNFLNYTSLAEMATP